MCIYLYIYAYNNNEKRIMNLKGNKEGCIKGFGERKGRENDGIIL